MIGDQYVTADLVTADDSGVTPCIMYRCPV